ncbi:Retrovirus-related Pol polyprotein from transposon TNT 1-94-like protein [Drosera capensis]
MDVRMVFLNGDLEGEIYMKQLEGLLSREGEHLVCNLKKSIYGLKQHLINDIEEIEASCISFLWIGVAMNRRMALVSWDGSAYTSKFKQVRDPLVMSSGPITRSQAEKREKALEVLVQRAWETKSEEDQAIGKLIQCSTTIMKTSYQFSIMSGQGHSESSSNPQVDIAFTLQAMQQEFARYQELFARMGDRLENLELERRPQQLLQPHPNRARSKTDTVKMYNDY